MHRPIAATSAVLIVAVAVAAALTACSSASSVPPVLKAAQIETGQTSERTYSQADLASILDLVNSSLGLGGSVSSGSHASRGSLNPIDVLLTQPGTSFTPAACVAFATSDGRSLLAFSGPDAASAVLTSSRLNLIAFAPSGAKLPTGFISGFEPAVNSTLATCTTVTAKSPTSGAPSTLTITSAPIAASVGANSTVGFTESTVTSGGGGTSHSSWTTLEAIDGNLELFVTGVSEQDVPSLEKALGAAVTAAKQ